MGQSVVQRWGLPWAAQGPRTQIAQAAAQTAVSWPKRCGVPRS